MRNRFRALARRLQAGPQDSRPLEFSAAERLIASGRAPGKKCGFTFRALQATLRATKEARSEGKPEPGVFVELVPVDSPLKTPAEFEAILAEAKARRAEREAAMMASKTPTPRRGTIRGKR